MCERVHVRYAAQVGRQAGRIKMGESYDEDVCMYTTTLCVCTNYKDCVDS